MIDFLFIVDVIITFRTTFRDDEGNEVVEPLDIAKGYIKGSFALDLISSIPFHAIFELKALELLGILKILRVARISSFIRKMNFAADYKVLLKIILLVLYTVLAMHWVACLWFIIVSMKETWMLNMDFVWVGSQRYEIYNPKEPVR